MISQWQLVHNYIKLNGFKGVINCLTPTVNVSPIQVPALVHGAPIGLFITDELKALHKVILLPWLCYMYVLAVTPIV